MHLLCACSAAVALVNEKNVVAPATDAEGLTSSLKRLQALLDRMAAYVDDVVVRARP